MNENNKPFFDNEDKSILLFIDGIEYFISGFFSLHYAEIYLAALTETKNSKHALACVISDKLKDDGYDVPINKIEQLREGSFSDFIDAIANDDVSLKKLYNETDDTLPKTERLAVSYKSYWEQLNVIPESLKQYIESYQRHVTQLRPEIEALSQIQRIIGQQPALKISQAAQAAMTNFQAFSLPTVNTSLILAAQEVLRAMGAYAHSSLFTATQQAAQAAAAIIGPIQESLGRYSNMLAETIAGLQFPTFSEERQKELIASHKKWGEYGWSMLPHAPVKLFFNCPNSSSEADRIALAYCKKNNLSNFLNDLRETKIRKKDLEEAIFCFENRQYTACALILFALIDAKLIRLQPRPKKEEKIDRRKTGASAIYKYKKKFESENDIEEMFFHAFRYFNLFKCLESIFVDTDDFNRKVTVVNRNYVGHGMNLRPAGRKDCIQLFFALYNLLTFLEFNK